jgi:hypothetical protein
VEFFLGGVRLRWVGLGKLIYKEWAMSKFAVSLSIAITCTCTLGCRNVAQMEVKEAHSASWSSAAPNTLIQQISAKFTPEAFPAKKGLAKAYEAKEEASAIKPRPNEYVGTNARKSQKDSICNSFQPLDQAKRSVSKSDNAVITQAPNMASKSKPGAIQNDDIEKGISANKPQRTSVLGLPKDVWYAIATVFGAVFSSILAPIVVEIIRGRLARHQSDQIQDSFRRAAKGQPS